MSIMLIKIDSWIRFEPFKTEKRNKCNCRLHIWRYLWPNSCSSARSYLHFHLWKQNLCLFPLASLQQLDDILSINLIFLIHGESKSFLCLQDKLWKWQNSTRLIRIIVSIWVEMRTKWGINVNSLIVDRNEICKVKLWWKHFVRLLEKILVKRRFDYGTTLWS